MSIYNTELRIVGLLHLAQSTVKVVSVIAKSNVVDSFLDERWHNVYYRPCSCTPFFGLD